MCLKPRNIGSVDVKYTPHTLTDVYTQTHSLSVMVHITAALTGADILLC